ncbi:hypothetical protein R3P38DRAFT_2930060 [Favolaschia claudopus]|uniref:Succinate dehydrogenase subunit 4 n=1 Tax=Favolaschia claudopus TaxID=2862362 RepID=A0AAW0BWT5_9AGAR
MILVLKPLRLQTDTQLSRVSSSLLLLWTILLLLLVFVPYRSLLFFHSPISTLEAFHLARLQLPQILLAHVYLSPEVAHLVDLLIFPLLPKALLYIRLLQLGRLKREFQQLWVCGRMPS